MVTENDIWSYLEEVADPEIPVLTVVDLGVIRAVKLENDQCFITITPTYSGCPAMKMIEEQIIEKLNEKDIIEYHSKNNDSSILFNEIREDERTINRVAKYLERQNQLKKEQLQSVVHYVNEKQTCKNRLILAYFGEKSDTDCGICSYCISKKKVANNSETLSNSILTLLQTEELTSREIQERTQTDTNAVIEVLQHLLEQEQIAIKANNKYTIHH